MNFLSSALNLLSVNAIPYTIKEKIVDAALPSYPDNQSIWTVYNGVNPKTDLPVSIFEFNLKSPLAFNTAGLARNCFKKLKLVKFPGIINIVDFIENESFLYIVTERATPLTQYLLAHGDRVSAEAKVYGIYNIANSLAFINSKANCLLGKLDLASSVYVNTQGEWRLFGFELLTNLSSDPDQPIYRLSAHLPGFDANAPPEVANKGTDAIRQAPFAYDAYRFGVFITAIFLATGFELPFNMSSSITAGSPAAFAQRSGIPKNLALKVLKLLAPQSSRITAEQFLSEAQSIFASNKLVEFSRALEEIKFGSQSEKLAFFKFDMANYIDGEFPPGFLDNKLLPEIIEQFNLVTKGKAPASISPEEIAGRQEATSVLLNFILKLSAGLSPSDFTRAVKPVLFHAFTLSDRSVRLCLLKYLPSYADNLTEPDVQSKIFQPLITGFLDTNFLIRETTLTSITTIIDKVSDKQVNQELLKILAKLQMDPKPSIRTNTLILIIKISGKIYSNSRNSVVITALAKALRDTFTPCKLAALSGFEKLLETFSLNEICSKILGHLAVSLMDPKSYKVRQESRRVFQLYLDSVEKHAASLPQADDDEDAEEKDFFNRATDSGSKESEKDNGGSALSFGWGMVNKFVSAEPTSVNGKLNNEFNRSTPDLTRTSTPTVSVPAPNMEDLDLDDDWGEPNEDDTFEVRPPVKSTPRSEGFKQRPKPAKPISKTSLRLGANQKKPGSTLKLDLKVGDEDDNWGDEW